VPEKPTARFSGRRAIGATVEVAVGRNERPGRSYRRALSPTRVWRRACTARTSLACDQAQPGPPVPPVSGLVEAWASYLGAWEWDWFCTFTFREDVHPEGADKRFRVLLSKLNRALFGPRWWSEGQSVQYVRALEYQRRGVIHFHALMRCVGESDRFRVMEDWEELAGFSRIYPPRSGEAVRRYCAKYVSKGGELEIAGGPWGLQVISFGAPGGCEKAPCSRGFVVRESTPEWWAESGREVGTTPYRPAWGRAVRSGSRGRRVGAQQMSAEQVRALRGRMRWVVRGGVGGSAMHAPGERAV